MIFKLTGEPTIIIGSTEERAAALDKLTSASSRFYEIRSIEELEIAYKNQVERAGRFNSLIGPMLPKLWTVYDKLPHQHVRVLRNNIAKYKELIREHEDGRTYTINRRITQALKFNMDVSTKYGLCQAVSDVNNDVTLTDDDQAAIEFAHEFDRMNTVFIFDVGDKLDEFAENETFQLLYRAKDDLHATVFVLSDEYFGCQPDFVYQYTDAIVMAGIFTAHHEDIGQFIDEHWGFAMQDAEMAVNSSGGRPLLFYRDYERIYML